MEAPEAYLICPRSCCRMMAKLVKLLGTLGSTDVLAVAKDPTSKGPKDIWCSG